MRYCLDLTPEQATMLDELHRAIVRAQEQFSVAVNIVAAGRGVPERANFTGLRRNGVIPENAVHLNGALPKCEGAIPMLDFDVADPPKEG